MALERLKIRVVAKRFGQTVGLDFNETFSLVAKLKSVIILLSLVVNPLDVKNVFLHELHKEVYTQKSLEFVVEGGCHLVCKL